MDIKSVFRLLKRIQRSEIFQAIFVLAFVLLVFRSDWISKINEGQKEEIWQLTQEKQKISESLKVSNNENMALKDEKRLAFQPVSAIKTEAQENPQDKKEESQDEIALKVKEMEQQTGTKEQTESKDGEVKIDTLAIQAQINDIKQGIESLKAKALASQTVSASADANSSDGIERVKTVNAAN